MALCGGVRADGGRCRGVATSASGLCYSHDPDHEQDRRRAAQKGGRRGGRGRPTSELARLRDRFEALADDVLTGRIERADGAVAGQLLNGARACVRDALAAREQEELVARLESLEAGLEQRPEQRNGGGSYVQF
jgi:hypothetical protein